MSRLLAPEEVEEFADIILVSDADISPDVLVGVRSLAERDLERFLREILHDPNETPHCSTEIGDILTCQAHVGSTVGTAAFVLKGRGFPKVASKEVTYQFVRLRQVPQLRLIVFAAVGNILDDAKRDFIQIASDADYDYLIMDAQMLARLLTAHEKLCPEDGTPYGADGRCENGHAREEGVRFPDRSGPIIVSPRVLDLGSREARSIGLFKVTNVSKYPYYDIGIGVTVSNPHILPAHLALNPSAPKDEFTLGGFTIRLDLVVFHGKDKKGRAILHIKIASLDPGEVYTFRLENRAPYELIDAGSGRALIHVHRYGQNPPDIRTLHYDKELLVQQKKALALLNSGSFQEATEVAQSALVYARRMLGERTVYVADAEHTLAVIWDKRGDKKKAEYHCSAALEIAEESLGPNHKAVVQILEEMASMYKDLGDDTKVAEMMARLSQIREDTEKSD